MRIAFLPLLMIALASSAQTREKVVMDMGTFNSINLNAPVDMDLCQNTDSAGKVSFRIEPEYRDMIRFSVANGVLTCTLEGNHKDCNMFHKKISKVRVFMPQPLAAVNVNGAGDLEGRPGLPLADNVEIKVSGAGDIEFEDCRTTNFNLIVNGAGDIEIKRLTTTSLTAKVNGAGDVEVKRLAAQNTDVQVSGAGDVDMDGTSRTAHLMVSGAGDVDCGNLICDIVTAKVSGSGDLECYAKEMVTATASASGEIKVNGNPATLKLNGHKENIRIKK